jgi:hypothetical protein
VGCCFFACIGAIWPRVALLVMWIFGIAPGKFQTWYWPLLGFFVMPCTTFVYQMCMYYGNLTQIQDSAFAMIMVGVAVLHDLGQLGMLKAEKDE